jgi:hypothetical protein
MRSQDKRPDGGGHAPFSAPDDVAVQRGMAEFQAGRPVIVEAAAGDRIVASPWMA